MPWTVDQKAAYLAAFIDGEGWVRFGRDVCRGTHLARQIGFTNTDRALFEFVVEIAADLGLVFATKTIVPHNLKHSTRHNAVLIGGEKAFRKFSDIVPLRHGGKRGRLASMLASYKYNEDGSVARGAAAASPEMRNYTLAKARAARGKLRIVA